MMRRFPARLALVDERRRQKNMVEHKNKVRHATPAIDCVPPASYLLPHLLVKPKKLQKERERIWRIEDENRRLLSRLNDIMNRGRGRNPGSPYAFHRRSARSESVKRHIMVQLPAAGRSAPALGPSTESSSAPAGGAAVDGRPAPLASRKPRPHSVAVMRGSSLLAPDNRGSTEGGPAKRAALCGCPNRGVHRHKPHLEKQKANVVEDSPVTTVLLYELQRGIQSVEITLKHN